MALANVASAQTPPRASGTVKASAADSLTITNSAGKDVTVSVPSAAQVVQVPPGITNLSSATPTTLSNVSVGDRVLVTGTVGDAPDALHAVRVIVMKSAAIAETHAAEEAAWQRGGGGLVQTVDTANGTIVVMSGARTLTVHVQPTTTFRRYSGDSVKFEDAVASQLSELRPGDQLRVRGTRAADGSSIQADAIVTGSFRNFSGLLSSIDSANGTITLKDLATKKVVTVKVSANSDLRRIPTEIAARFAARTSGAAAAGGAAPAGGAPAGGGARPAGGAGPAGGGARAAGSDLSQMLSRLPTETLGGLKVGEAVMIVATQPPADAAQPTAVTLLAGVEPILQASPKGDTQLSPWSMGGDPGGAGGGAGPGGGGGGGGAR